MKHLSKETKIGITTVCALAFLIWGINYLKGVNILKPSNHYYVVYPHVDGLAQSAIVNLDGFQVGTVKDIQYMYDRPGNILVELILDDPLKLPIGTQAVLTPDLIGAPTIALVLGENTQYYQSGDTILPVCQESLMDMLSQGLLQEMETLVTRANSVLSEVETQLAEGGDLQQSLASIRNTTMHMDAASQKLDKILQNEVPSLLGEVENACQQITVLGSNLSAIDFQASIGKLNQRLDELQPVITSLNSPDNSIGMLLNDTCLYFNINQTVQSANQLLLDLKAQPKRYVHFSVFGSNKEK